MTTVGEEENPEFYIWQEDATVTEKSPGRCPLGHHDNSSVHSGVVRLGEQLQL